MKKSIVILSVFSYIAWSGWAWAYDAHHPNPMSILNGHHHARSHRKPRKVTVQKVPSSPKLQPWRMYKRTSEGKYIIKPEPYSIAKKQRDPELLGPQRTYTTTSGSREHNHTTANVSDTTTPTITPETCIEKLGKEKYDNYVQKYGGEAGAIQRCRILLRVHS